MLSSCTTVAKAQNIINNSEVCVFLLRDLCISPYLWKAIFWMHDVNVLIRSTYGLRPHSHYIGFILYHILDRIRYQNFTLFTLLHSASFTSISLLFRGSFHGNCHCLKIYWSSKKKLTSAQRELTERRCIGFMHSH